MLPPVPIRAETFCLAFSVLPYLFLAVLDGQFQAIEAHPIAVLKGGSLGVVVEHHLQLVRAARVVEEGRGEILALLPQFLPRII